MIPAGMPTITASSIAKNASSTVAGNSVVNSPSTGSCVVSDEPRSPVNTCRMYSAYCCGSGRSSPNSRSSRSRRAGSIPRSPDKFSTGSPGIRCISANASSVTPMNVGTISAARRRMKANIRPLLAHAEQRRHTRRRPGGGRGPMCDSVRRDAATWIPAFAGMTNLPSPRQRPGPNLRFGSSWHRNLDPGLRRDDDSITVLSTLLLPCRRY